MYRKFFKRFFDVLLSGCALILLSPVLLIVAVLVRTKLGSPVIFCQERPGKNEKIFKMYKFRSMTDARDENGVLLPDEVRLTRLGRILRSTSLPVAVVAARVGFENYSYFSQVYKKVIGITPSAERGKHTDAE